MTCRYCGREMDVSRGSYEENPFCRHCLHERIAKASEAIGPTTMVQVGDYVQIVPSRAGKQCGACGRGDHADCSGWCFCALGPCDRVTPPNQDTE